MGNCLASDEDGPSSRARDAGGESGLTVSTRLSDAAAAAPRKSQPLRSECPTWRSEQPLTAEQLRRKRDEFWDTAPAFDGRKEIWDALKAAVAALESADQGLAQAIIDGAGISLPRGTLSECYDELGTCYQLPPYILGPPTNLAVVVSAAPAATASVSALPAAARGDVSGGAAAASLSRPAASATDGASSSGGTSAVATQRPREEVVLKLRLSTGKDLKLPVNAADSVAAAKQVLSRAAAVQPAAQRWFFGGRALDDKSLVRDLKIPPGYVVQVLVVA